MTNSSVTPFRVVCQMSTSWKRKKKKKSREWKNESRECVCGTLWGGFVCVQQIALRSCLTFPLTALNFSWCQDCQRERRRERGRERWEGGGEYHVRRLGWSEEGGGVCLSVSGDTVRACMFWRGKVSACSPIITCWCVMKVRPVCGVKPYHRVQTGNQADTVLVCGLKHHPDICTASCSRH